MKEYNFGEQTTENINGKAYEVWQSPKYKESKQKATEMINSNKYDLSEADFWILKNTTKSGNIAYSGLIISHNGCLKINDKLENPVNPKCFTLDKEGYANSLVYTYCDEDTYEVGEFNSTNGKNAYPYAMAFKRCFDRVVLKKSKLAYSGIYSEVESDEFKEQIKEVEKAQNNLRVDLISEILKLCEEKDVDPEDVCNKFGVDTLTKLTTEQMNKCITALKKKGK